MADAEDHSGQTPAPIHPPTPDQAGKEASGYRGTDPSTAGPGQTAVRSETPENREGHLNPSAPEDANVTPGSMSEK